MPGLHLKISQGDLQGCTTTTKDNFQYNSYMRIPYAKPPIGELRFQDPQPYGAWSGIRDATVEGPIFCQFDVHSGGIDGEEDSLFVNVFAPASAQEGQNIPVMVWVHGGGFTTGSGNKSSYGPDYLVQKNVIVVTFNYRLGVFGFLCLDTADAPGNAGMKDQVLALRWVNDNIHKFGGDRCNITIFGESAGSASVQYLMVSPMAKGLFHKAIMQSGSCLCKWAQGREPEVVAFILAEKLGFKSHDKYKLLKFFREMTAKDLVKATSEGFDITEKYNFIPVLEKEFSDRVPFLSTNQLDLLKSGSYNKIPCIMGFNSQECLILMLKELNGNRDFTKMKEIEETGFDMDVFLPLKIVSLDSERKKEIMKKVKDMYFTSNHSFIDGFIDLMSDLFFIINIDQSVKLMGNGCQPIYYYKFSYNGMLNLHKKIITYPYTEATHADEIAYIFKLSKKEWALKGNPNAESNIEPSDATISERLVEMWTNFAKFGNPTAKKNNIITTMWKPINKTQINCLEIGKDMEMITDPFGERIKFWNEILNSIKD